MKKYLLSIAILLSYFIGLSQSSMPSKKREVKVSKYNLNLDKNTPKPSSNQLNVDFEYQQKRSFNYQYSLYLNSDLSNKNFPALLSAYEIDSSNSELYFELAKYYELKQNSSQKKAFCKKLKATKLSPALREYAYNTLMSVEKNGILITYGEDDTYPIWILQSLEKIRTDVKVITYDLLVTKEYRGQLKKDLGLKFAKKYSNKLKVLQDIAVKNSSKPIYYALTVSHSALKELKSNLYPTGLALKYSKKKFSNNSILMVNWNNKFKKQYISNSTNSNKIKKLNMNYVLPLIQISGHYKSTNLIHQHQQAIKMIRAIGKNAEKTKQIEALLTK